MGYSKILIYGNIIESINYENPLKTHKKRHISKQQKTRTKAIKTRRLLRGTYERTPRSIKRSREAFFRLVHHNNHLATSINFVTLTFMDDIQYANTNLYIKKFFQRINKEFRQSPLSYISVPELTKKGRYHFHLLVYNLPAGTAIIERKTRYLQRQFNGGFLDIRLATTTTEGIAGYMAKYLAKHLKYAKTESKRGYTCSSNLAKPYIYGSNTLSTYENLIIPEAKGVENYVESIGYNRTTGLLELSGYQVSGKEESGRTGPEIAGTVGKSGESGVRKTKFLKNDVNSAPLLAKAVRRIPNPENPGYNFSNIKEAKSYYKRLYEGQTGTKPNNDPLGLGL